jgi:hypothetical protein
MVFLSLKELRDVILDVEVTLNNRPLSYVEDDIQFPILTPNSLLYGRSNVLPELEPHQVESKDLRKRAKHLRRCKDAVWRRWKNEYLRGLRERHNQQHGNKSSAPKVGEVVIIKSDERNRGKWKLGVVETVIVGIDNVVRGAKVRTGKSVVEIAVQHLFPLELSCDKTEVTEQVTPAKLNVKAPEFQPRPKRQAAVEAKDRITAVGIEEEEEED